MRSALRVVDIIKRRCSSEREDEASSRALRSYIDLRLNKRRKKNYFSLPSSSQEAAADNKLALRDTSGISIRTFSLLINNRAVTIRYRSSLSPSDIGERDILSSVIYRSPIWYSGNFINSRTNELFFVPGASFIFHSDLLVSVPRNGKVCIYAREAESGQRLAIGATRCNLI